MTSIPRDKSLDSALSLVRDGYQFIQKRRQRFQSDIFETRLLFSKTICMGGKEHAELFYDNDKFIRNAAIPKRIQKTLVGEGGIQGLDGEEHRRRKAMFMALLAPESAEKLASLVEQEWQGFLPRWETLGEVNLFQETQEILMRAVCAWAGVLLSDHEARRWARDMGAMVDGFGAVGLRHWRGRKARRRSEEWIGALIEDIRSNRVTVAEGTAAHAIAWSREANGQLLPARIAVVELLNVLRPFVAIATYITYLALALHEHPELRAKVQSDDGDYTLWFVQEVRRYYPFTPFVGARVLRDFDWKGYRFEKGARTLLDVYGMLHDPNLWEDPEEFRPERFREWQENQFDFIPQGGGSFHTGHRCGGEWITIEVMQTALRILATSIVYETPPQNLVVKLSRIPAMPESGFVMRHVRRAAA